MTIYTGSKVVSADYPLIWGSPDLGNKVEPDHLNSWFSDHALEGGTARQVTQPVDEARTHRSGHKSDHFGFLDFFNKIHIEYNSINLGNIVSTQNLAFYVFNSYFEPRTLEAVLVSGGDGLVLTQPADPPLLYGTFQQHTYQLSVSTEGPPTVHALYTFQFDNQNYSLEVVGNRLVLFPYEPDGEVVEQLQWLTDVLESHNGTEQRIALRGGPRQRIEFEVVTEEGTHDTKLRSLLFDWMSRVYGLPIWWEMRRLNSDHVAGTSALNVSTEYGDFRVGGLVMIYKDEETYEVIGIEGLTANSITLQSQLVNDYTRKAVVMPVRTAYMAAQASRNKTPTNVSRTSVAFTTINNPNRANTTGSTLYGGKVLLDDANYVDSTANETWEKNVTVIDAGTGLQFQISGTDRARMRQTKRWIARNSLQEVWRIRRLLHHFDGNRVSFYIPSFRKDLELVQTIAANTATIRVAHCNFTSMYKARKPFKDVRIVLKNGTTYVRSVVDSSVDGDSEVLSLNAFLQVTPIFVEDVERIEFVSLVRIANDRAKLVHRRAGTAQIDINLISCKE